MQNSSQVESFNKPDADETLKYGIMFVYAALILISGFFFNSVGEIISGLGKIIVSRSVLVSDYMEIGNIGATLVNCGLTTLASIIVAKIADVEMDGLTIAAIRAKNTSFILSMFCFFN